MVVKKSAIPSIFVGDMHQKITKIPAKCKKSVRFIANYKIIRYFCRAYTS